MTDAETVTRMLVAARPWFEEWRSPVDFESRRREIRRAVDASFQFNRGEAKWLLEAWLISKFGRLKNLPKVKLNRSDPPDAFVQIGDSSTPIEITEILEPGRLRGLEYRPGAPEVEEDPVEDWVRRADQIPSALLSGIRKKTAKAYPPNTQLLVYLNIGEWGIRQRETEAAIKSILSNPTAPFSKIYILWNVKLFDSCGVEIRDPAVAEEDVADDDVEIFRSVWT